MYRTRLFIRTSVMLLLTLGVLMNLQLIAQNSNKPHFQSNPALNFSPFLNGLKYADIALTPQQQEQVDKNKGIAPFYQFGKNYLLSLGFEKVALTSIEKLELNQSIQSYCDATSVFFSGNINKGKISELSITFVSCNNDIFQFQSRKTITFNLFSNLENKLIPEWQSLINQKIKYNPNNRLELPVRATGWSESKLKEYYKNSTTYPIEGVYERIRVSLEDQLEGKYKIGIVKDSTSDEFLIVYIGGAKNVLDWEKGELKGRIIPTATPGLYKAIWYTAGKDEDDEAYCFIDDANMLNITSTGMITGLSKFIKLMPLVQPSLPGVKSSGSGFVISKDGLVATNYHVIENARQITLSMSDGSTTVNYKAEVKLVDKKNDLAILQITDPAFKGFEDIPYGMSTEDLESGESVFVLGYPLISTMGEGIKLTNGIISSSAGYQGDETTYQVSAPVQPGNSGGPLFDKDGNVIGIVNAKHAGAENASYAIKLNYLNNLIRQLPGEPDLPSGNLEGVPLKEQVKQIKNYVFLVKVN